MTSIGPAVVFLALIINEAVLLIRWKNHEQLERLVTANGVFTMIALCAFVLGFIRDMVR